MLLFMLNQQSNYNLQLMVSQRSTIALEVVSSCTRDARISEISNVLNVFTILHPDINLEIAWVGGSNVTRFKAPINIGFPRLSDEGIHLRRHNTTNIQSRRESSWILITLSHIALCTSLALLIINNCYLHFCIVNCVLALPRPLLTVTHNKNDLTFAVEKHAYKQGSYITQGTGLVRKAICLCNHER